MRAWLLFLAIAGAFAQNPPDLGSGGVWLPTHVANVAPKIAIGVTKPADPGERCLPPGVPRIMLQARPLEFVQQQNRILILFEGGAHVWRQIWMDGRAHPKDPNPDWLGDSVGRWEGQTLVADTVGFNDKTWLDDAGHKHTERLHVTERFTRTGGSTMKYEATVDDAGSYAVPIAISSSFTFRPGGRLAEDICLDKLKR